MLRLLWLVLICCFPAPGGDAATTEVRSVTAHKERHHKERASEAYTAAAGLWLRGSSRLVLVLHRTQLFLERPRQRLDFFLVVARPYLIAHA